MRRPRRPTSSVLVWLLAAACSGAAAPNPATGPSREAVAECADGLEAHPEWVFCDDFESTGPLAAAGRYFEYGDDDGDFVPVDGVGVDGSRGMRVRWQAGEVSAGGFKLGLGRTPNAYMDRGVHSDRDFRELYYRMYLRHQPGWQGDPAKLSRAIVFASSQDWSQAMIAHLWGDGRGQLLVDPATCVEDGQVVCQGYNDFAHLRWLGSRSGKTAIFSREKAGRWRCVEAHVRLNDPGHANGVQEFWIDDGLEARRDGLDFVGDYSDYAINAIFFENYWNAGSPVEQERYFDDIVVSTQRIGCR